MSKIRFKAKRIDNNEIVKGFYFKTPLTDENSKTDPITGHFFLTGYERHCISTEFGVVYVVEPNTVEIDIKSLDGDIVPFEEYLISIHSKVVNAKDDALSFDELLSGILNILKQ